MKWEPGADEIRRAPFGRGPEPLKVFAIGDLHLSHRAGKPMDVFGEQWRGHADRIAGNWRERVSQADLVLVPGDISWAMRIEEAEEDLAWLDRLPGRKVILKGNHDYWWPSISRLRRRLEGTSIAALQYDSLRVGPVAVAGTRLWSLPGAEGLPPDPLEAIPGERLPDAGDGLSAGPGKENRSHEEKIFRREIGRLEQSLKSLDPEAGMRIAMTHFPPTNEWGVETVATRILEKYGVRICVFGHLHNLPLARGRTWDFVRNGVRYVLASCDAVQFSPYLILEIGSGEAGPDT